MAVKTARNTKSNRDGIITHTLVYEITSVTTSDAADAASPALGTQYGTTSAYCTDKDIQPTDNLSLWIVTCTFSTAKTAEDLDEVLSDRPSVIGYTFGTEEEEYVNDYTATTPKKMQNTAKEYFDPPQRRLAPRSTISWSKYFTSVNYQTFLNLIAKTNSAAVSIDGKTYGIGQLLIVGGGITKERRGTVTYAKLSLEMQVHRTSEASTKWSELFIESRGRNEIKSSKLTAIIDPITQQPVDQDYPLDAQGAAVAITADGVTMTFVPYESAAFPTDWS